jgi:hypothetical protein
MKSLKKDNMNECHMFLKCVDETLPIAKKPKHPKKGEQKEQNGRTHV